MEASMDCVAAAGSFLETLLPDTVISILQLLADEPQSIVAFSLTCSQAQQLCSDRPLWSGLVKSVVACMPRQLQQQDWSPAAWDFSSHKQMYITFLHPYRALLQQRYWHTTKMPSGQLLVIDAQPPQLVASSVFFDSLQGPPLSYPIFALGCFNNGVETRCCSCLRSAHDEEMAVSLALLMDFMHETGSLVGPMQLPAAGEGDISPVQLQFQPSAPATAASTAASHGSSTHADTAGFNLSCRGKCGMLYAEQLGRVCYGVQYKPVAATGSSGGRGEGTSSRSGDSNSASSSNSLPLPDIQAHRSSVYDLRLATRERDIADKWRSRATYRPFNISTWLQLPGAAAGGAAAAAAAGNAGHMHAGGAGVAAGPPQLAPAAASAPSPAAAASPAAVPAAAALTGLWRGTYGVHGVELLQVQLLLAPPGYDLLRQHPMPAETPDGVDDCVDGVLLQSLLHRPGLSVHPQLLYNPQQGGSPEAQGLWELWEDYSSDGEQEGDEHDSSVAAGSGSSGHSREGADNSSQQDNTASSSQQQLLLVCSKVTGDRNVPAGQVTFAIDLSSSSSGSGNGSSGSGSSGIGRLLQLPHHVHSSVEVNAPGTRPLVVKERYRGLAQIASTYFQDPKITPVELLLFEDTSCFGVLWAPPMDTFSFFVRQPELL